MPKFKGIIKAKIIDARFPLSGKVVSVSKHTGEAVKRGNVIASLDRKILQAELDRQLADHDKVRADFDGFAKKFPDPQDDNKYTKAEKQAALNASVKVVEIAKAKLDQADLFSPVNGVIIDDSGITPGLYVTPAGGSVKIVDVNSYWFEINISQNNVHDFLLSRKCKISVEGTTATLDTETSPVFSDGKNFVVQSKIEFSEGVLPGMEGTATFD